MKGELVPATPSENGNNRNEAKQKPAKTTASKKMKPLRLKNFGNSTEAYDILHRSAPTRGDCGVKVCRASLWHVNLLKAFDYITPEDKMKLMDSAKDFLDQYYTSVKRLNSAAHHARLEAVRQDINMNGTYDLTKSELSFGAKLAWRNAARCIGRIQWNKLQLFDARHVTTPREMFDAICNHIKYATNYGNIRSAITVFPQKKPGSGEFRVWNQQLIGYAGYRKVAEDGRTIIVGDPVSVEFTEVCQKLGWVGAGTRFDVLPLVLQAADSPIPEVFPIPPELVLEVELQHPTYDWFAGLGLRWFAVPAVSGMAFDCGGLHFTGAPFNGWYMSTEIGTRDLGDAHRYNQLEAVAKKMGLDTRTYTSLWKDRAVVELNVAVLYSFQQQNVTIVDHHTAAESFMTHLDTEMRVRGGCPAEWVWIVPPMSGSLTPVFHQEMVTYALKPSFEYQEAAWKKFRWDGAGSPILLGEPGVDGKDRRLKERFRKVAWAVAFASFLFVKVLQKRIKITILYASETGKSEKYARMLASLFNHAFNPQVMCMAEYEVANLDRETLVLIVTSTTGDGDPPENGEALVQELKAMADNYNGKLKDQDGKSQLMGRTGGEEDNQGSLKNIRFAVFALGSSVYPTFCSFGKYMDALLGTLDGQRMEEVTCGDEMSGQEDAFKAWAHKVFQVACKIYHLEDVLKSEHVKATLRRVVLTADTVRFLPKDEKNSQLSVVDGLSKIHGKKIFQCPIVFNKPLAIDSEGRKTIHLGLRIVNQWTGNKPSYEPGDHIGVFPVNNDQLVAGILARLSENDAQLPEGPIQLQILMEQEGKKVWQDHDRLPPCDLRTLLSHYLDITTPASQNLLAALATHASSIEDKRHLQLLATDARKYEEWKHWGCPNLLETLEEFPSVTIDAALLVSQLPVLQPRYYSISSSPLKHPERIDITAGVVSYRTKSGEGPIHYGLCSNYMSHLVAGDCLFCFYRSAPNFHLPIDTKRPIVMVGPGTGVAPFRGFWQHKQAMQTRGQSMGPMLLFTGYRTPDCDLYANEKAAMVEAGVLDHNFLALSRFRPFSKTYVQDKLLDAARLVYRILSQQNGHFYVCGDSRMAEDVAIALRAIFQMEGGMDAQEAEAFFALLKSEKRYLQDVFGISYRTRRSL